MKLGKMLAITAVAMSAGFTSVPAQAQDRYLAEVILVGQNFCPRGTLLADGQLLPIAKNTALFSLLGTTYGGDGRTTFGLPDLRGRVPAGTGGNTAREPRNQGGVAKIWNGNEEVGTELVGMRYCVVTEGLYPSRR